MVGLVGSRQQMTNPILSQSARNPVYINTKDAIWFIAVVWRTCRVMYITGPSQNLKYLEICPDRDAREPIPLPLSDEMDQIPATEALGCRWVPIRWLWKTSVIVVGHTCRVIYITSLAQHLKNVKIFPDRDPREP